MHLFPWAPDGAHISQQHIIEAVCMFCVFEHKKKNQTFDFGILRFGSLILSLSQLPTCLACLQSHHMGQILTLGKISARPFSVTVYVSQHV